MYVGVDLGTTNIKVLITDEDGRVVARASEEVNIKYLDGGVVHQDMSDICCKSITAIKNAVQQVDAKSIKAVGVSSQGGALQILDSEEKPYGAVISWLDNSADEYNRRLTDELGGEWFAGHTGHPKSIITPGQLLKLQEENRLPDNYKIGYVGDMIIRLLTGVRAHDHTSCSLAMLYNPYLEEVDRELLEKLGISENQLPRLMEPYKQAGTVTAEAEAETNLPGGVPVSAAVHDQYAAAIGCGAVNAGDIMLGAGTAWVLLAVSEEPGRNLTEYTFICNHVVEGLYGEIISLLNGGSAVRWALKLAGMEDIEAGVLEDILRKTPAGCDGVIFSPRLAGEGSEGRIAGLKLSHGPEYIIRAVIEGLAMEVNIRMQMLGDKCFKPAKLLMAGQAAMSETTPQIIADITGIEVRTITESAVSAMGASIIARNLLVEGNRLGQLAEKFSPETKTYKPGKDEKLYNSIFKKYLRISE